MLLYARNAQVLWLAFAFLFPFDTALEPYLGIPERFRTVLASNLHAKNGSERFSVMARYMLSILIDSCRTVVVVLAPVLPHNVVDVELAEVLQLKTCLNISVCRSGFFVFYVAKITKSRRCDVL